MVAAKVVFTALPYATGDSEVDSSDYFLREFKADPAYTDVFTYTIVDEDGSTDSADLTIKIKDDGPTVVEGECRKVFEDDLPDGTSPNAGCADHCVRRAGRSGPGLRRPGRFRLQDRRP